MSPPGQRRWRRGPTVLACAALIAVLLIGGGAYYLTRHRHGSPASRPRLSVLWSARTTGLGPADRQSITSALAAAADSGEPALATGQHAGRPQLLVAYVQRKGDWVVVSGTVRAGPAVPVEATEPIFFIGRARGSTWSVGFPDSAQFCGWLARLPAGLRDPTDDRYFGC